MAFISGFGTGFAVPILALAASLTTPVASVPQVTPPPTGEVDVRVEGLRSTRGLLRFCLTRDPRYFPACEKDPAARRASASAGNTAPVHFAGLATGDYAVLVLHDENGNARVDTMLGIPREGVGFSRNPRLFMGPPPFDKVHFAVGDKPVTQVVHLRYFL